MSVWVDLTFNTHQLAYLWNGAIDEVLGRDITQEQPIGYKLPPTGAPPCVPPGNRWKQWSFKNPATGAITSPTKRPPPMMPKGGVTTNDPLNQRPPPPPVPKENFAPREGLAFGDLEPLPIAAAQPRTPTPSYVAGREAELSTFIKNRKSPEARGNKIPVAPKATISPVRSPPAKPQILSGDELRAHTESCPLRRVKCGVCYLVFCATSVSQPHLLWSAYSY